MESYWWRSQSCEDNAMFGNYYEYLNQLLSASYPVSAVLPLAGAGAVTTPHITLNQWRVSSH